MRLLIQLIVSVALAAGTAFAVCNDLQDVLDARAAVDSTCDCTGASTHGVYVRCARGVINSRIGASQLPPQCAHAVLRCATHSTCGRGPGVVACCTHRIEPTNDLSAIAACRIVPAQGCHAAGPFDRCASAHTSCCDACDVVGRTPNLSGCATTTTPTSTTTTTT
jgi:hypothetical protein